MASEDELIAARRKHVEKLVETGERAFPNGFVGDDDKRREAVSLAQDEARCAALPGEDELAADAPHYPLYGRVMAKRGPFLVIKTPHGDAQALVRPDNLSEEEAARFKAVDLADHVAVSGPLLRTRTGALTVKALTYRHLGKALLPPPAKWHGLTDVEKRYRERYVDLFANPEVANVFRARSLIIARIRSFLEERGFLEVETPVLQPLRGGATARPFSTHHNALDIPLYLRVAPELYLKRLIVGGLDRVYEMARTFRNEGVSTRHNPEFTLMELYQAYATYEDLMDLSEALLKAVDADLREAHPELGAERSFDFGPAWPRVTMRQAILDRLQQAETLGLPATRWQGVLDEETLADDERLSQAIEQNLPNLTPDAQAPLKKCISYGERIYTLFELLAEEDLDKVYRNPEGTAALPVFITEFPVEVSPLARKNDNDPRFVDRFELFIEHKEVANAFSELNDPDDQAARFRAQLENRQRGDEEAMDYDADYIRALQHGMPPTAGLGVGVDRLVMILCGRESIRDVLLFPLLKPETT